MNDIIKLLNLEDPDVIISSVNVQDGCKEITLERKPSPKYCPYCKTRMHSKGIRKRSVNHPMMQDGFSLRNSAGGNASTPPVRTKKMSILHSSLRDAAVPISQTFSFLKALRI